VSNSSIDALYTVRSFLPETDMAFIKATWLRGLYYGDSWYSKIPKAVFMDAYSPALDKLLTGGTVEVVIACQKEDPDVILGYSVLSKDAQIAHFVYVKSVWRQKGIARRIMPSHPASVSHLTKLGLQLLPKLPGTIFNPFKLS